MLTWTALAAAWIAAMVSCAPAGPSASSGETVRSAASRGAVSDHAAATGASSIDHVILLSVDGLRPEAFLPPLVDGHPGLRRLIQDAWTPEARCDPDISITLPNHIGMVTGRLVAGPAGHGWTSNEDPPSIKFGGSLHAKRGSYVSSVFDVAHEAGVRTAVVAGKWKFALFEQSYSEGGTATAGDPPPFGRDKIDCFVFTPDPIDEAHLQLTVLHGAAAAGRRSFSFLHLPTPDFSGHGKGWDLTEGSEYRRALLKIDAAVGALLDGIEQSPDLRRRVAIVLTADHAGGVPFRSHTDPEAPVNFTIPFVVWRGGAGPSVDLYEINPASRRRPARSERFTADAAPPIRNADAGNACLSLLGLPAIPGSQANAKQDLTLIAPSGR
jgi:hypothetical protein